jgi:muconolactone delta-isomerase
VRPETPIDVLSRLLLAQMNYLDGMKKEGKIKELYHLIGKQGIAVICDVGSDEELSRLLSRDPLFFHMEREIYPVIAQEAHRKLIKELLEK